MSRFVASIFIGGLSFALTHAVAEISESTMDVGRVIPDAAAATGSGYISADLNAVAAMVNEVEDRRRRVVYTAHPGAPTHGVQHGFVHVSDGSVAFSKIDLVVNATMPIVVRRAYQSGRQLDPEFGDSGWTLSAAERISADDSGKQFSYAHGNNLGVALTAKYGIASAAVAASSEISDVRFTASGAATVVLRSGIVKRFEAYGTDLLLRSVTDRSGNRQDFEYDDGLLSRIRTSDGAFVRFTRDAEGRVTSAEDSFGRSVRYQYDDVGRLVSAVDLRSEVWSYEYGANGRLTRATSPLGTADLEFQYDLQGRAVAALVNGYMHDYRYDGLHTRVTDENHRATTFTANAEGLTVRVSNSVGTITEIETDDAGRPVQLLRNGHIASSIVYSSSNKSRHPESQTIRTPGTATRNYLVSYDKFGRVTTLGAEDDRESFRVTSYGNGFLPKRILYGDKSASHARTDADGNLAEYGARDGFKFSAAWDGSNARIRYGEEVARLDFDAHSRLSELHMPDGTTAEFQYDPGGLRKSTRVSTGIAIDYFYDSSGALFYTEAGRDDGPKASFVYEIDQHQRLRSIAGSGVRGHHDFSYNLDGRLSSIDSTMMSNMSFLYDDAGRLEAVLADGYSALQYAYAEGEPDIVAQFDNRTRAIFNQQFAIADFVDRFSMYYTRVTPSSLGALTYDDRLSELLPSIDPQRWTPDLYVATAVENTKIRSLFASADTALQSFSMPSSRFFIPAEYWSVNCCYCCPPGEYACEIP